MSRMARVRAWWVVSTVVVLVVSLLVGPTDPAAGTDGVADHTADYSACVGPATESAGFRDVVGSFAEDAVNCLAHYEITVGNSQGLFAPSDIVPRWQVALFLARAAVPAGVVMPPAEDQGFTDLDKMSDKSREAINQLAALRIMPGTSDAAFSPYAKITRQEMAVMLSRFLEVARVGPGGANIRTIAPDDDVFTDLHPISPATRQAIRKLYEMGVTRGTTAFTFSPRRQVNRAQMAAFITRMLAHTNARPAGLNIQVATAEVEDSDITLSISYRNRNRRPLAGKRVDIFMATFPDKAFDESGHCTGYAVSVVGRRACVTDSSDRMTGSPGNVLVDLEVGDVYALRVWAWTGAIGGVFDEDAGRAAVIDVKTPSSVAALEVSDDMGPTARKLRFGDTVTFTFQLVDADGDPVRKPGVEFTIDVKRSRNRRPLAPTTISKETGPDGSAEVTFRHPDPSDEPGDVSQLDLDIRRSGDLEVSDRTTVGMVANDGNSQDVSLEWADEPDEPTTVTLSVTREYRVAPSQGNGAGSTVRARLTDQYGSAVAGKAITFTSSDDSVAPRGVARTTDAGGVATLQYRRDSDIGGTEWITGRFGNLAGTARQYWAARIPAGAGGSGEVRVVDTDSNTVFVVTGDDIRLVEYDAGDHFRIGSQEVRITSFEDDLTVGDMLAYEVADSTEAAADSYTLTNR